VAAGRSTQPGSAAALTTHAAMTASFAAEPNLRDDAVNLFTPD